jgi:ABC-type oligopeptide transport system ATPase subunit
MIEVSELKKVFPLTKQQRSELQTTESFSTAVDSISFSCQPPTATHS